MALGFLIFAGFLHETRPESPSTHGRGQVQANATTVADGREGPLPRAAVTAKASSGSLGSQGARPPATGLGDSGTWTAELEVTAQPRKHVKCGLSRRPLPRGSPTSRGAGRHLDGSSAGRHEHLHRGGVVAPGELLLLRLPPFHDGDCQEVFVHLSVQVKYLQDLQHVHARVQAHGTFLQDRSTERSRLKRTVLGKTFQESVKQPV